MIVTTSISTLKDALLNQLEASLKQIEYCSYQLILIVLDSKVQNLLANELRHDGIELINVSKLLSQRLVCLSAKDRVRQLENEFAEITNICNEKKWLTKLDLIFEPSLNTDPIMLLKWLSKSRPIIAIWPGKIYTTSLVYAEPGSKDYRTFSLQELKDIQVVNACNGVIK